jgi:hypothetical protein
MRARGLVPAADRVRQVLGEALVRHRTPSVGGAQPRATGRR